MSELLTRRAGHELLQRHGYPISYSTFTKVSAPSCDPVLREKYKGPPPVAAYIPGCARNGLRPLYDPAELLAWANSLLIKPASTNQQAA